MSQIGPHAQNNSPEGLAWARVAPVGKATRDSALLQALPDHAIKVWRRPFSPEEQDRWLAKGASGASALVGEILSSLGGYRHKNLYCEILNEIGRINTAAYIALCRAVVPLMHAAGVKVLVPSFATGDWELEDWVKWREAGWCGADGVSVHAYWGLPKGTPFNQLFTLWNALRYRSYWKPQMGDPNLLVVTEFGRDKRLNDSPAGEVGAGGYLADGLNAEEMSVECLAYSDELARDGVVGTLFTDGPDSEWNGYNADPVAPYLQARAGPAILRGAFPVVLPMPPKPPPVTPVVLPDLYPDALYTPLIRNFDTIGTAPKIVVVHGTAGLGNPYLWWNRWVDSRFAASGDIWIPKSASEPIRQYVRLVTQTSWSNGPLNKPDLSVPFIKWLVVYIKTHPELTGNWWPVSVEFEKSATNTEGLTASQVTRGKKLFKWLHEQFAIPLDRQHFLEHRQFDSVTRGGCPGPIPWTQLGVDVGIGASVGGTAGKIIGLRDTLWQLKDTAWNLGREQLGNKIRDSVRADKGEINWNEV